MEAAGKKEKKKEVRKRKDQVRSAENRRISPRNIDRIQPEEKTKKNIRYYRPMRKRDKGRITIRWTKILDRS